MRRGAKAWKEDFAKAGRQLDRTHQGRLRRPSLTAETSMLRSGARGPVINTQKRILGARMRGQMGRYGSSIEERS
jgi:hypothetical protein